MTNFCQMVSPLKSVSLLRTDACKLNFPPFLFFMGSNTHSSINFPLKVPKRENFLLAFFALSEPIWVCDLGTGPKNQFFYHMTPDSECFWFFAAY
jgi:hypothetical protein